MCPKAAMYLVCNAVETSCVPFMQHLLISLLLASSHCVTVSADSALFLPRKRSYSLISLLGRKDNLFRTSRPQLSYLSSILPRLLANSHLELSLKNDWSRPLNSQIHRQLNGIKHSPKRSRRSQAHSAGIQPSRWEGRGSRSSR